VCHQRTPAETKSPSGTVGCWSETPAGLRHATTREASSLLALSRWTQCRDQRAERQPTHGIHRIFPAPLVAEAAESSVFIGPQSRRYTGLSHDLGRLELGLLVGPLCGGEACLYRLVPLPALRHIAQHGRDPGHLPRRLFDKDHRKFQGKARAVFPEARHREELPSIGGGTGAITR
jgi:hypothetical protein